MRRMFGPAVLLAILLYAAPAKAALLTFDSVTVNPGDTFTIDVRVADVVDLFTFGFDVVFDQTVLAPLSVSEGAFLGAGLPPDSTVFIPGDASTPGTVSFIAGSLFDQPIGVSGSGILASLTFQALASGPALLDFANVLFFDSASPAGAEIPVELAAGTVTVAPSRVPEPSVLMMLGLGLAGAARRQWRSRPQGRPAVTPLAG